MSVLIDKLVEDSIGNDESFDNKTWYIAKPMSSSFSIKKLWERLKDAWRVITGKSIAVHYKKDEL